MQAPEISMERTKAGNSGTDGKGRVVKANDRIRNRIKYGEVSLLVMKRKRPELLQSTMCLTKKATNR